MKETNRIHKIYNLKNYQQAKETKAHLSVKKWLRIGGKMETNRRKFFQALGAGIAGLGFYPATGFVIGPMPGCTAKASASEKAAEENPEQDVQQMLLELCDIAGYGIHSGIHPGPKADKAANYILDKLRMAGLANARLDLVKVNDVFPKSFSMNVATPQAMAKIASKATMNLKSVMKEIILLNIYFRLF
jgi:hypothetical protein